MNLFFFFSFLFLAIAIGLPVFWQIKRPDRDASLIFIWKAVNFLLLIGFLITFFRASWLTLLIFTALIFSVAVKKKVAGAKKEERTAEPIWGEAGEQAKAQPR